VGSLKRRKLKISKDRRNARCRQKLGGNGHFFVLVRESIQPLSTGKNLAFAAIFVFVVFVPALQPSSRS
jgi:hypothetical protein